LLNFEAKNERGTMSLSLRRNAATLVLLPLLPLSSLGLIALASGAPAGASTKAITVKAIETNFHIALSVKHFKPGTYIFLTENKGQSTHALEITGPGLHDATTKNLAPGQNAKLKVTLKSGKYDVFCPVPGHKALGMNVNLVISASGGNSTTATTTKAASSGVGY
jgi:Copper binding proteins, plastocyanin/azurin family